MMTEGTVTQATPISQVHRANHKRHETCNLYKWLPVISNPLGKILKPYFVSLPVEVFATEKDYTVQKPLTVTLEILDISSV